MELRLGHQVFHPGDFVLWHDIAPDAAPLLGDRLAAEAAATGAGLVCADPARALAAGVRPDGIIVDAGAMPAADQVAERVVAGYAVLVTLVPRATAPPAESADAGLLAAAAVYAWLGVRVFRVAVPAADAPAAPAADPPAVDPLAPEAAAAGAMRQVLDMVASIRGTRQPAVSRRALA